MIKVYDDLSELLTPQQFELAAKHFLNPNQWIFESHPEFRSQYIDILRSLVIHDVLHNDACTFNGMTLDEYVRIKTGKENVVLSEF